MKTLKPIVFILCSLLSWALVAQALSEEEQIAEHLDGEFIIISFWFLIHVCVCDRLNLLYCQKGQLTIVRSLKFSTGSHHVLNHITQAHYYMQPSMSSLLSKLHQEKSKHLYMNEKKKRTEYGIWKLRTHNFNTLKI